ncbi:DUF2290 domain-containing protein [Rossellomorea marisflavi]|uniref:DUF2290 domain-containing protein n=1 Tax=Rossellomorea marisflavi TaxID=189381 RepID=UPI001EE321F2|nr:DUF2290 domain-containing protein [Rossellomorea marisflavi]MCM2588091.1 DUF2290 domain-containing protein [Rossellomorea marisflavi]UKS66179.1 DUF2290 domain-containing protein [Rossellomorea marisflavi]UTE72090.1 DUF2290 domain-containing protein [Rossellomorea marisflavi]
MEKINNEYEVVCRQIMNLYLVQERIPSINDVNIFNINEFEIGERTNKLTQNTYPDVYKELLEEKKYNILINDESIISFHYLFDDKNNIKKHSLSFIPSLDLEIALSDELTLENRLIILQNTNNYLRIDFDLTGKKNIVHTDVHMHYGIFHTEYEKEFSEFRIPLEGIFYPNEFIYLVFKYIYDLKDEFVNFLLEENYNKKQRLEECEIDKLILSFNRNSFVTN